MWTMIPFTYFTEEAINWRRGRNKRKGEGPEEEGPGEPYPIPSTFLIVAQAILSLCFYLFPLYFSPGSFHLMICGTHIVYSAFRLNFIGKKNTPVSTDLMRVRGCEILLWNPAAHGC